MSISLVLFIIAAVVAGVAVFNTKSLIAGALVFIAAGLALAGVTV